MEDFGEKIKVIEKNNEVLLKLFNKESSIYFGLWLTSLKIEYRYFSVFNEDDMVYNEDNESDYEFLFWISHNDWEKIKEDLLWEKG